MMKITIKKSSGVAAISALLASLHAKAVLAVSTGGTGLTSTGEAVYGSGNVPTQNLPIIIGTVINYVLALSGTVVVALFVYAGFLWTLAQGEPAKVKKAKDIIFGTVIGLLVIFLAYAISEAVIGLVTQSTVNQ